MVRQKNLKAKNKSWKDAIMESKETRASYLWDSHMKYQKLNFKNKLQTSSNAPMLQTNSKQAPNKLQTCYKNKFQHALQNFWLFLKQKEIYHIRRY